MEIIEISRNTVNISVNSTDDVDAGDVNLNNIQRIDGSTEYEYFFREYLLKNQPCIVDDKVTEGWPCTEQWRLDGKPNFKKLTDLYGNCEVPVANCKIKYYNAQWSQKMLLKQFIDYWDDYGRKDYPSEMPVLYLKDWHCLRDNPHQRIYQTPKFFGCDWLNEYYSHHPDLSDDFMFVYMGPKGSWTPLHEDVFTSYSWSANIVGRKRWLLFPPGEESNLCDAFGQLLYDTDSPEHNSTIINRRKSLEVIQQPGEIIFIPSGWHHQVWNLDDTISINHNWINGCNIMKVWKSLRLALLSVMKEIEDCCNTDNWINQCQTLLKASHGMDYLDFYNFLHFIIKKRLDFISNNSNECCTSLTNCQLGYNHVIFDLNCAKFVLKQFINDTEQENLYHYLFHDDQLNKLIHTIEIHLDKYFEK